MKKSYNEQAAQGDVLLTPRDKLPDGAKRIPGRTVAEGEATGHHHTFTKEAEVYVLDDVMWVVAEEPGAELHHQEHDTIWVEPGIYEVTKQVEPDPFLGVRRVAD